MAPHFSEGLRSDDTPTTRTLRDRKTVRDFTDDIDSDFGILRGNTGIPDEKFGPDEERIIIDDDPYDLDEAIFALQNRDEDPRSTPKMITHRRKPSPTKSAIDFIEESIRNAKRHEARTAKDKRFGKKPSKKTDLVEELISAVKQEREKNPSDAESKAAEEAEDNFEKELPEIEIREIDDVSGDSDDLEKSLINESEKRMNDEASDDDQPNAVVTSEPESVTGTQMESEDPESPGTTDPEETNGDENSGLTEESTNTTVTPEADGELTSSTIDGTVNTWEIITSTAFESGNGDAQSTLQPVVILGRSMVDDLKFEWVTTDWSECSQTCGGGGFQMRGAQCTVRPLQSAANATQVVQKTAVGATLCEDAGLPVPEKVRPCGGGRCPQWHTGEWTPCETSRCFTWQTAMQRRDVTCRIVEDGNGTTNATVLDSSKCDESVRPPQRLECYNDACKGVWRVGEWSECTASCEEDGVKYRILQCVWFGTKKAAGNACRDVPRPSVMKTCKGPPCLQTSEMCKDLSQFCGRVKAMNMCRVPLYQKQCCLSCRQS